MSRRCGDACVALSRKPAASCASAAVTSGACVLPSLGVSSRWSVWPASSSATPSMMSLTLDLMKWVSPLLAEPAECTSALDVARRWGPGGL